MDEDEKNVPPTVWKTRHGCATGAVITPPRPAANLRSVDAKTFYINIARIKDDPQSAYSRDPHVVTQYHVYTGNYFATPWDDDFYRRFLEAPLVGGNAPLATDLNTFVGKLCHEHHQALRLMSLKALNFKRNEKPDEFVNVANATNRENLQAHVRDLLLYRATVFVVKTVMHLVATHFSDNDDPTVHDRAFYQKLVGQVVSGSNAETGDPDNTHVYWQVDHAPDPDVSRVLMPMADGTDLFAINVNEVIEMLLHQTHTETVERTIERQGYKPDNPRVKKYLFKAPLQVPYRICAPPRQGKSAIALALVSYAVKMNGICFLGVSPNKNVPVSEFAIKLQGLQWQDAPSDKPSQTIEIKLSFVVNEARAFALREALWRMHHSDPQDANAILLTANTTLQDWRKDAFVVSDVHDVTRKPQPRQETPADPPQHTDAEIAVLDQFASVHPAPIQGVLIVSYTMTLQFEGQLSGPNVRAFVETKLTQNGINADDTYDILQLAYSPVPANGNGLVAAQITRTDRMLRLDNGAEQSIAQSFGTAQAVPAANQRVHVLFYSLSVASDVETVNEIRGVLDKRKNVFVLNIIDECQFLVKEDVVPAKIYTDSDNPIQPPPAKDRGPRSFMYGHKTSRPAPDTIAALQKMYGTPMRGKICLVSATQLPTFFERKLWGALVSDGPTRFSLGTVNPSYAFARKVREDDQPDPCSSPFFNYDLTGPDGQIAPVATPFDLPAGKCTLPLLPALVPTPSRFYYGPSIARQTDTNIVGVGDDGTNPMAYYSVYKDDDGREMLLSSRMWTMDAEAEEEDRTQRVLLLSLVKEDFTVLNPTIELRILTRHFQHWLARRGFAQRAAPAGQMDVNEFHARPLHVPTTDVGGNAAVCLPMHLVASERQIQFQGGLLEEARWLSFAAAHRMHQENTAQCNMAALRLHYGVAFLVFSSIRADVANFASGGDALLVDGFENDAAYQGLEEDVTGMQKARCFLAVFDPAVPSNRKPGACSELFADPRKTISGLKKKANGAFVPFDDDAQLLDGSLNIQGDVPTVPEPTYKNTRSQPVDHMRSHPWCDDFPDLSVYNGVRLIGYPCASAASAVKVAREVHGIVNVAAIGYGVLTAGLTLQTTFSNDTTYKHILAAAADPEGDDNAPIKVCYVPKSFSVASSKTQSLEDAYQLYGRASVDMRGVSLPEIAPNVPWTVEVLGSTTVVTDESGDDVELPMRHLPMRHLLQVYSRMELLFASFHGNFETIVQQIRNLCAPLPGDRLAQQLPAPLQHVRRLAGFDTTINYTLSRRIGKRATLVPHGKLGIGAGQIWRILAVSLSQWKTISESV